jgi:hypothetical protein
MRDHVSDWVEVSAGLGDRVDTIARRYADEAYAGPFMTDLRNGTATLQQYVRFIRQLYPLIVDFNRGLIRSITKIDELERSQPALELVDEILSIDHVRSSPRVQQLAQELRMVAREAKLPTVRAIAGQLKEEQEHNDYYRAMLELYGVDHQTYITAFEDYLHSLDPEVRESMTTEVLSTVRKGPEPHAFPDTPFSQGILAVCHYLRRISEDPTVPFVRYNAVQSGVEFLAVKSVSESIFPGVAGPRDARRWHPDFVPDAEVSDQGRVPPSIRWWDEHADYGRGGRVELQHVKHSLAHLNGSWLLDGQLHSTLVDVDNVLWGSSRILAYGQ